MLAAIAIRRPQSDFYEPPDEVADYEAMPFDEIIRELFTKYGTGVKVRVELFEPDDGPSN